MPNIYYYPVGVETGGSTSVSGDFVKRIGDTMTGTLGMTNNKITDVSNGVAATDVVNKQQLDDVNATALTAQTTATAAQTTANDALPKAGGTMTGAIAMGNNGINTVGTISGTEADFNVLKGNGSGTGNILAGTTLLNGSMSLQNGEVLRRNISTNSPSDFITSGIGTNPNVTNNLYSGEVIICKSGESMRSGTVVSFADANNDTDDFTLTTCKPANTESGASSQPVGVLLEDATANAAVRVAVSGITTCISNGSITYDRGGMLQVAGTNGKVTQGTATSNEAGLGICLSGGSKNANDPVLVMLHANYESF
jgi:hypothetical protein